MVLLSLWLILRARSMFLLSLGNFLYSATNNLPAIAYMSVIPEVVPPSQRALAGGCMNMMMITSSLAANFLTFLVGDHDSSLSVEGAFYILIGFNIIDIPLGLIGVGAKPGL